MARTDTLGNFLTDVAGAIRTKAGTSDPIQASAFDTAIANIPSGGNGWQRPSDWWDTETILANAENKTDNNGDTVYPAYILLLADWDKTTTFSARATNASLYGDGYLTSDGAWYGTTDATHTWDETKDKPCSEGYKTRYVIVYVKNRSTALYLTLGIFDCLEIITGNATLSSLPQFGSNSSSGANNLKIKNIVISSDTIINNTIIANVSFSNCIALKKITINSSNPTTINSNAIMSTYNLETVDIPNITTLNSSCFYKCYGLNKLILNKLTSFQSAFMSDCYCIDTIELPSTITTIPSVSGSTATFSKYIKYIKLPDNFNISGMNLTNDTNITHSCIVDMISKLKDVSEESGTYTLTLGATNLAKISADELAIGTNKGWTIN